MGKGIYSLLVLQRLNRICKFWLILTDGKPNSVWKLKTMSIWVLNTNILSYYRLSTMVSIIIFSLSWKFGVFIVTTFMCIIVFIIPSLATLYNEVQGCNHNLADRAFLFIPVPSFHQKDFLEDHKKDSEENIQKSRIKNKAIICILVVLVVLLQYLITKEVIPFLPPDLW